MPNWFLSADPGYVRVAPDSRNGRTPVAAFSTRRGGMSAAPFDSLNLSEGVGDDSVAVRANRRKLFGALGLDLERIAWATQVHGAHVLTPRGAGLAGTGDALVARGPEVVLAVGAADCLAVLAWDRAGRAVAAAHAGWRGLVAGILPRTLDLLAGLDVAPEHLEVALGPRIGPCCFVVGPEVAARFPAELVRSARHAGPDRVTVDLAAEARRQLLGAGVGAASILDQGECTACRPESYFSHRRDRGRTGRAWGLIALIPASPASPSEVAV
jgi:YfiH family protein